MYIRMSTLVVRVLVYMHVLHERPFSVFLTAGPRCRIYVVRVRRYKLVHFLYLLCIYIECFGLAQYVNKKKLCLQICISFPHIYPDQ